MKKVAFMAHGPASGNVLKPLIDRCTLEESFMVDLYAFHPFVAKLWNCEEKNKETYPSLFDREYDYIFYGTGSHHEMECKIPLYAKENGIRTVSILDAFWCDTDNLRLRYKYPPDILIVPNENSKKQIIENGIMEKEKVFSFGNPHFDRLKPYKLPSSSNLTAPYDLVVFSQCSATSDFSDTAEKVKECLHVLNEFVHSTNTIGSVTVTPHPRENIAWLSSFCENHGFQLETNRSSFELLLEKDVNIGVNCTLQFESLMIGKPTIFYTDKETIWQELSNPSGWLKDKMEINFNATDAIFNWMMGL